VNKKYYLLIYLELSTRKPLYTFVHTADFKTSFYLPHLAQSVGKSAGIPFQKDLGILKTLT
jgi:hypothetical protein